MHIRFRFSTEINCNIIYKGKRLLIHLVRPTTKEAKNTQYNGKTHENILV